MNVSPQIQKIILSVLIISGILYVAYSTFTTAPIIVEEGGISDAVGQDIIDLADKLENVSINKEIFTSSLFESLVDTSAVINNEEVGRVNPFDPYMVQRRVNR